MSIVESVRFSIGRQIYDDNFLSSFTGPVVKRSALGRLAAKRYANESTNWPADVRSEGRPRAAIRVGKLRSGTSENKVDGDCHCTLVAPFGGTGARAAMNHARLSKHAETARHFRFRPRLFDRAPCVSTACKLDRSLTSLYFYAPRTGEPTRLDSGCPRPEPPEHGEMFVLWSGLLVQFRCSGDYKLVGAAAIICRNRTWTQDPPVCLDQRQWAELRAGESNRSEHEPLIGRD